MSFCPTDAARPCCSSFAQPVSDENRQAAVNLQNRVERVNRQLNIVYRPNINNVDIFMPVIRWVRFPYQQVFREGFLPLPQGNTPDNVYYDLDRYVHQAGAPLDPNRPFAYAYTAATIRFDYRPIPNRDTLPRGQTMNYYRYEIYAPGGIWVAATLGDSYQHRGQAEVCFVGGIAPQYIRSCIVYTFTRAANSNRVTITMERILRVNAHFNPQAHPQQLLPLYRPIHNYVDEGGVNRTFPEQDYTPDQRRRKREISNENQDVALEWYAHKVVEIPSYITGAFRSARENEAYLFMENKYVLINYAPGTTNDKVLNGPILVRDGFPSLIGTPFGEQGIGCAFTSDYDSGFPFYTKATQAYIFNGNICAYIDYAPGTTDDKIILGPITIAKMFPFFKNTVFEDGIDAAFNGPNSHEAYLFRGDKYALINYDVPKLIHLQTISEGFPSLQGTIFASDIQAAFASHYSNKEAYLFKGKFYALINFAPGTTDDYIVGGHIKKILPNWPSLSKFLPLDNKGVIYNIHQSLEEEHDQQYHHDEL